MALRTDQPPCTDGRVRRAISQALDRQAIIKAVYVRGEPTPAIGRGLAKWSLPIDPLNVGAKYSRDDPKEAKRLLAEAGFPKGFQTPINATVGYGPDWLEAVPWARPYRKDGGIETAMTLQEYGASMATTFVGKFEGMAMGPISIAWEPDSVLYGLDVPAQRRSNGHVNPPQMTAMLQEQRRTKDLDAGKPLIFDIQCDAAGQQYCVYTNSSVLTGSWQPYVTNFRPSHSLDCGPRVAAFWLERSREGGMGVTVFVRRVYHEASQRVVNAHQSARDLRVRRVWCRPTAHIWGHAAGGLGSGCARAGPTSFPGHPGLACAGQSLQ
jgi:peptide/nickel transport system substrate-binding protein